LVDVLAPWLPAAGPGLTLEHVRVDRARVRLSAQPESGELGLARVFAPSEPRAPGAPPSALTVTLKAIELGVVDVELDLPATGRHALRVDHVRAAARVAGEDSEVTVERFGVLMMEQGVRWLDGTGTFRLRRKGALDGGFHGFV